MQRGIIKMHRPEFSQDQEKWLCHITEEWYLIWKNSIAEQTMQSRFRFAKEMLKKMICIQKCENCKRNYMEKYNLYLCKKCLQNMIKKQN